VNALDLNVKHRSGIDGNTGGRVNHFGQFLFVALLDAEKLELKFSIVGMALQVTQAIEIS